jgi:cytochrome c biogenesis protein CcdA
MQYLSGAVSMGLGCGTCCCPVINLFLSIYTMSHAKSIKKAVKIFLSFFVGKAFAVVLICMLTSFIGKQWISKDGYIGRINMNKAVETGMLLTGIVLICSWIYQKVRMKKKSSCKSCGTGCKMNDQKNTSKGEMLRRWPGFAVGFFYGITPCAPMLLLVSYSLILHPVETIILSIAFTAASSLSPMLIMVFIAGVLSKKMYEEIPKWVEWIRLVCYIMFVVIAAYMLWIE